MGSNPFLMGQQWLTIAIYCYNPISHHAQETLIEMQSNYSYIYIIYVHELELHLKKFHVMGMGFFHLKSRVQILMDLFYLSAFQKSICFDRSMTYLKMGGYEKLRNPVQFPDPDFNANKNDSCMIPVAMDYGQKSKKMN